MVTGRGSDGTRFVIGWTPVLQLMVMLHPPDLSPIVLMLASLVMTRGHDCIKLLHEEKTQVKPENSG